MQGPSERYLNLGLAESLQRFHRFHLVCTELSFLLRHGYSKFPKNVQTLIFQDTISAFRFLPLMQAQNAISAANLLHQSAGAVLPKQKRILAFAEFKRAKVAYKRRHRNQLEEGIFSGSAQLPPDVLMHIFSFLDVQSLVSVALVCWPWNLATQDDSLWRSRFLSFFGNCNINSTVKEQQGALPVGSEEGCDDGGIACDVVNWRAAFKRAFSGNSSKKCTSYRGYCTHCNTVVWINNMDCPNRHPRDKSQRQQIKPLFCQQMVGFILDGYTSFIAFSDSEGDSDSDDSSVSKLWAYPKHVSRPIG